MKNKIWITPLIIMGLALIFTNSCKKKENATIPVLVTSAVTNVKATTASSGGIINNDGGADITARGICWHTGADPTIADNKTTDGAGAGTYTSLLSGLTPGATYCVRAYATNSAGTGYGSTMSFTTINSAAIDTIPPVITLNGSDMKVTQFTGTYTELGATATDNIDGMVTVVISGVVNSNSAGDYIITYTATDAASNTAIKTRTVTVSGSDYLSGLYTVDDYIGSTYYATYSETLTASSTFNNRIIFTKFAYYVNGTIYGTVSGTTITIPQQTVYCGSFPANRTFSGSGTYSNNFTSFTLNYTETTNGTTATGYGLYTRN